MTTKACTMCKVPKPVASFWVRRDRSGGYFPLCKPCAARNARENKLKRRYGISEADYQDLLDAQGGGCAICRRASNGRRLHVDHRHATGDIRGLLCTRCNLGLGYFKDATGLLIWAVEYLERGSLGRQVPQAATTRRVRKESN